MARRPRRAASLSPPSTDTIGAASTSSGWLAPLASAVTRRAMFRIEAGLGECSCHWAAIATSWQIAQASCSPGGGASPAICATARGPLGRLGIVVAGDPEPGQRADEAQRRGRVPAAMTFRSAAEKLSCSAVIRFSHISWSLERSSGSASFGQGQEELGVGGAGLLLLTGLGQPLGRVGAYRLQQPVPRPRARRPPSPATCPPARRRRSITSRRSPPSAHTCSAPAGVAPPLNTDSRRSTARSGSLEQLPAPVHHGAQRLVAGQRGRGRRRQQPEPVVEPVGHLRRRSAPAAAPRPARWPAGCRPAPGRSGPPRPALASSTVNPGRTAARPVGEQPHRRRPRRLAGVGLVRRQRQRRHRAQRLPGHAERLPAGGQDAHARAPRPAPGRPAGGRVDQVLAVVQDQQQLPGGEHVGEPVQRGQAASRAASAADRAGRADHGQHGLRHVQRVPDRGQRHEPDAVGRLAAAGPRPRPPAGSSRCRPGRSG